MAMMPPPSPGPSGLMGPPPSPSSHGLSAAARFHEPHSPAANTGSVPPSPMSRLLTPPRFALPSVEAGGSDRELVYTTDHTSVLRSPFAPNLTNMPEFGLSSDASPSRALLASPMNPAAALQGASGEDTRVMSGTPYKPPQPTALPPRPCSPLVPAAAPRLADSAFSRTQVSRASRASRCHRVARARRRPRQPSSTRRSTPPNTPARSSARCAATPVHPHGQIYKRGPPPKRSCRPREARARTATARVSFSRESPLPSHPARDLADLLPSDLAAPCFRSQNAAIAVHVRAPARR